MIKTRVRRDDANADDRGRGARFACVLKKLIIVSRGSTQHYRDNEKEYTVFVAKNPVLFQLFDFLGQIRSRSAHQFALKIQNVVSPPAVRVRLQTDLSRFTMKIQFQNLKTKEPNRASETAHGLAPATCVARAAEERPASRPPVASDLACTRRSASWTGRSSKTGYGGH